MIRDENGLLTGYVYVDLAGRDPAGYVEEADALLKRTAGAPSARLLFLVERAVRSHGAR